MWSFTRFQSVIQPLLKVPLENQRLFKAEGDGIPLEDGKRLQDYGINSQIAKAQTPFELHLALRQENGFFEDVHIVPYTNPPPLPDVMKESEKA